MTLRNNILNIAKKPSLVKLEIPELEGEVYIKSLPLAERLEYEKSIAEQTSDDSDAQADSKYNITPHILTFIYHVCDEKGKLLFTQDDIEALSGLPYAIFRKVNEAVVEMTFGSRPKTVEQAEKN